MQRGFRSYKACMCQVCVACLGEVSCDESQADPEIGFVEIIRNIPAKLAILAPLLHHSVEEGQDPHQWPECLHNSMRQVSAGATMQHIPAVPGGHECKLAKHLPALI